MKRLTNTKAPISAAWPSTVPLGNGAFMPSATKNRVTKKSRTPVIFEMTSEP